MKKYIILTIALFFMSINIVNAEPINAECVNNGTCLILCNYVNKVDTSSAKNKKSDRNLTIYYYYETSKIKVSWETYNNAVVKIKSGAIDYVFSTSGDKVYWGIDNSPSLSDFVCPSYGFLDLDKAWTDNELCFDNDGETCRNNYSNYATSFGVIADYSYFASHEKNYDFEEEINKYIENDLMDNIIKEINNGTFSENNLSARLEQDFTNYFNGNTIPTFVANSPAYANLSNKIIEKHEAAKKTALEAAEEKRRRELYANQKQYNSGVIDEETFETKKETIESEYKAVEENWNTTSDEIKDQVDLAFKNLNEKINWSANFKTGECDSYLGNPTTKGSPAYYLQFIFNLMKYAAIIILFVFSVVEMAKAMTSNNQDAFKKALQVTVKRLIIVVIIFFLPELIKFLLTILGAYSPSTCGIS